MDFATIARDSVNRHTENSMSGTPRDHVKDKGFWDGGSAGHGTNKESSSRASGLPGVRKPNRTGVRTDLDYPPTELDPSKR
jgi:hypothetical protein